MNSGIIVPILLVLVLNSSTMTHYSILRVILSIVSKSTWQTGSERMFFQRIRDMREDSDLTQVQVSKLLGIQQTVYSRYERGFQTIPLEHLLKLADYYNVSLDFLTGRTNKKQINK